MKKKFVKQIIIPPFSNYICEEEKFLVQNDNLSHLVMTVERFYDPIRELIKFGEDQIAKHDDTYKGFDMNEARNKLEELLKDARDVHEGNK